MQYRLRTWSQMTPTHITKRHDVPTLLACSCEMIMSAFVTCTSLKHILGITKIITGNATNTLEETRKKKVVDDPTCAISSYQPEFSLLEACINSLAIHLAMYVSFTDELVILRVVGRVVYGT
jgi:hypothetical protein